MIQRNNAGPVPRGAEAARGAVAARSSETFEQWGLQMAPGASAILATPKRRALPDALARWPPNIGLIAKSQNHAAPLEAVSTPRPVPRDVGSHTSPDRR